MSRDVAASPLVNTLARAVTEAVSTSTSTSASTSTLAADLAQTFIQAVVQQASGQPKLTQGYAPNDLFGLNGSTETTPQTAGSGGAASTLNIDDSTTPQQVAAFLGPLSQRPKMALTQGGSPYWVLGTFSNDQGQTMVRTSNPDGAGGTSDTPLADFMKQVKTLDTEQSGAGTGVMTPATMSPQAQQETGLSPGTSYKFNAFYQEPKTQQMMVSLTGPQGAVSLPASQMLEAFGQSGQQQLLLGSLSPGAQSDFALRDVGGPTSDGNSFSIAADTTPEQLGTWLSQTNTPQVAADANGKMWLVDKVSSDASGQPQVMLEDPNSPNQPPVQMPLAQFTKEFNMVDRSRCGSGTPLKAANGNPATFMGLTSDAQTGAAGLLVKGSNGQTRAYSLQQFAQEFGQPALSNALNDSLSEPAKPRDGDLEQKGTTTTGDASGEVQDDPSNPAGNIDQGSVGDCFFLAALGSVETQNPQALQQMIRPSQDGDPGDYDVRFFVPDKQTGGMKPVWITVDDKLPTNSNGQFTGDKPLSNASGLAAIAPALLEKAYAKFNQIYHVDTTDGGYDGIDGGNPGAAMETLTGNDASSQNTQNGDALWATLQSANSGTPVVLGTQASNSPEPGLAPNIVQGHAYTVLKAYTDPSTGEAMVTLRNPWGKNTDASGNPISGTNGVFTIPLSEVQKYFTTASAGSNRPYSQPTS